MRLIPIAPGRHLQKAQPVLDFIAVIFGKTIKPRLDWRSFISRLKVKKRPLAVLIFRAHRLPQKRCRSKP